MNLTTSAKVKNAPTYTSSRRGASLRTGTNAPFPAYRY